MATAGFGTGAESMLLHTFLTKGGPRPPFVGAKGGGPFRIKVGPYGFCIFSVACSLRSQHILQPKSYIIPAQSNKFEFEEFCNMASMGNIA